MIRRRILNIWQNEESNLEDWKPHVTVSIRNVLGERMDINVNIQPATIDLDFRLFGRLHLISAAFAFIADRDYSLNTHHDALDRDVSVECEAQKRQSVIQTIAVQTPSILVRFHVNNDDHVPRRENVLFEFDGLVAKNEKIAGKEKGESDVWNLDVSKVNVFLVYDNEAHLVLSTRDTHHHEVNSLRIFINNIESLRRRSADDALSTGNSTESSEFTTDLEKPHCRWWEEGAARSSKDIKFPRGDRKATTRPFEQRASKLAPTHIEITLPKAEAAVSKSVELSTHCILYVSLCPPFFVCVSTKIDGDLLSRNMIS